MAGNFHFALTHEAHASGPQLSPGTASLHTCSRSQEHATLMAVFGSRDKLNVSHSVHSVRRLDSS